MKLKLGFLVRRKMRRWGQGKGPLSKEQIEYLDKHVHEAYYSESFWHYTMHDMPWTIIEEEEGKNDEL